RSHQRRTAELRIVHVAVDLVARLGHVAKVDKRIAKRNAGAAIDVVTELETELRRYGKHVSRKCANVRGLSEEPAGRRYRAGGHGVLPTDDYLLMHATQAELTRELPGKRTSAHLARE